MTPPRNAWHAIARLANAEVPASQWWRLAGDDFPLLVPFLAEIPDRSARRVPCVSCGAWLRVTRYSDGKIVTDHEEDAGCTGPRRPVTDADLAVMRFSVPAFRAALARALAFEPTDEPPAYGLAPLGSLAANGTRLPIFFAAHQTGQAYTVAVDRRIARHPGSFILLCATTATACAELVSARGSYCFVISDLLSLAPGKRMAASMTLADAMRRQEHPAASARPPLSLKGRRYEIDAGFTWIRKLSGRRERHDITNIKTRKALEVLVAAGAGSEATALSKAELCDRVHELSSPGKPRPKTAQPYDLFRRRVGGRVMVYPFYDDLVGTNTSGGLYWLKL